MASLFQRRLTCFYCGRRSAIKYQPGLHKFKCDSCEAVNHLDSNGEITDPPAEAELSVPRQYARPSRSITPPSLESHQQSAPLFCATCLKNQHLITQNLANYLPPPDDPRYSDFEKKYSDYKRSLEERYPPVCEDCEPAVRAKLKATRYAVGADNLRRSLERTRHGPRPRAEAWRLKGLFAFLGFCAWIAALAAQVLYHVFGALTQPDDDGLLDGVDSVSFIQCVKHGVLFGQVDPACESAARPLALNGIVLGALVLWWNPLMSRRRNNRTTGLSDFYWLQLLQILIRGAAHYTLSGESIVKLDGSKAKAFHALMLILNLALSITSYRTPRVGPQSRILFKPDTLDEPLVPQRQRQRPQKRDFGVGRIPTPPGSQTSSLGSSAQPRSSHIATSFPINRLSSPPRSQPQSFRLPTPPPEDDPDAMDIDTPDRNLQIAPSIRVQAPTPLKHQSQAQWDSPQARENSASHPYGLRSRNPNRPSAAPSPTKSFNINPSLSASQSIRQGSSAPMLRGNSAPIPITLSYTSRSSSSANAVSPGLSSARDIQIAAPRFFASGSGQQTETGLEGLFSATFSLSDEPAGLREGEGGGVDGHGEEKGAVGRLLSWITG